MADENLGLSDRDKELKKWNAPYRHQPHPKMLFRGRTTGAGRIEREDRTVGSEQEERLAKGAGWVESPQEAIDRETKAQADLGTAAAERAAADRHLSQAAQAEAAEVDAGTAKHLGEIPDAHKRKPAPKRE
jgi:hypothetical protein